MIVLLLLVLFAVGCSSPTAPTPTPPPVVVAPPAPAPSPSPFPAPPSLLTDARYDSAYYRDFAQGQFEANANYGLSRLNTAPRIFLNIADERGTPIHVDTLNTVSAAFVAVAGAWSGGAFGLAGIERGTSTRAGQAGWITVLWNSGSNGMRCGEASRGEGAVITFYYRQPCGCAGSAIKPSIAKHELGHAFGYWHTRTASDLMSSVPKQACDMQPSEQELFHSRVAYSLINGSIQ